MASRLPPIQGNWSAVGKPTENQQHIDTPSRGSTRMLIERASELKNSAVAQMLEGDDGCSIWHDRHLRGLLQEHLHVVTSALKRLGHDIESLESQLNGRDQVSAVNNTMMRNLEVQQATSINDLRSRIARCDANISVLSGDMRKMFDSVSTLMLQTQNVIAHQTRTEKLLEEKISWLGKNSEEQRSHYGMRLRSSEERFEEALAKLDTKLKTLMQETKQTVEAIQLQGASSQLKLEREMTLSMESAKTRRDKKVDDLEQMFLKRISTLDTHIEELEMELKQARSESKSELQEIRQTFRDTLQGEQLHLERRLRALLEDAQRERSVGLEALRESLTSLRAVLEGKQVLIAEELRGEISKMKKLVVFT